MSDRPVAVLGGTGVFGSRLARLLARDRHFVLVVARRPGRELAEEIGGAALALDRDGDLGPLFAQSPLAVIDAAGPFHASGDDPYWLARACIEHGVACLDLADDAGFCAGIAALDAEARDAGVAVLSGVSSVPALSAAVVRSLGADMDAIGAIDTAILPGNRAPRGVSVMASILGQLGTRRDTWIAGAWLPRLSWSAPRRYPLAPGLTRTGCLVEVPDTRLFPAAFDAGTVTFRAGLELRGLTLAMRGLSGLFAATGWRSGPRLVRLAGWLAGLVERLGSDRGGMVVAVTGRLPDETWRTRRWTLLAEAGEGPFVPAVAVRALVRDLGALPPGARPAIGEVTLEAAEAAMADLSVTTTREDDAVTALFPRFLGPDYDRLPEAVRATHAAPVPQRLVGRADITRGTSPLSRLIAAIFRFPAAGMAVPLTVLKDRHGTAETWTRRFGEAEFRSTLRQRAGRMTERFGPITFVLDLHVARGALHYPVIAARIGPVPIPRLLLPESRASETADGQGFLFDVALHAPLTGALIVRYLGRLAPAS